MRWNFSHGIRWNGCRSKNYYEKKVRKTGEEMDSLSKKLCAYSPNASRNLRRDETRTLVGLYSRDCRNASYLRCSSHIQYYFPSPFVMYNSETHEGNLMPLHPLGLFIWASLEVFYENRRDNSSSCEFWLKWRWIWCFWAMITAEWWELNRATSRPPWPPTNLTWKDCKTPLDLTIPLSLLVCYTVRSPLSS